MKDVAGHPDLVDQPNAWIDGVLASIPARAAAVMAPAIQQLSEFAELAPGWDTYDAAAISPTAIKAAVDALVEIARSAIPVPVERLAPRHVAPLADGGVQLEWDGACDSLEIEFGARGAIGYLLARRSGPERRYEDGDNLEISDVTTLVTEVMAPPAS